ncbi:1-deoxy-D-xylulose-5-phosphate synthase [Ruminococcus sp. YE71]|uniref:1-deoxy-D-xylulose-5-phosphate synthase n=1 Tax=unclassified Ruminococcus TaxID=2608920 RepID=UPI00088BAB0E|nr:MULTISPECIES: 1-deoxy-D-xylulose-5-phosphate synthase [unclassified Ruminococcus]SDA17012.1 1-deoxy-D-xylulose-5-phosphate synthase [Ruminococcus sp. YE78]SFW25931.1 1-deoxy-D-xylulose-5-phosphate synthase [Ruminococcus sp. YE71]
MKRKAYDLNAMKLPEDLKALSCEECSALAAQIREVLIKTVSKNGGHLSSNLGTVELTISIHRVFDSPKDKIVWDVGHQSYTHKLLTGRASEFSTIRTEDGLSGFPRPDESVHDAFVSGHSSTSVSAALGIATAMKLRGDKHHTVAVIGDGAFTGGEAFEGLNNAGKSGTNLIIILNYNEMSISKNVGATAKYLATLRTTESYHKTKTAVERVLDNTPIVGAPIKKVVRGSKNVLKDMIIHSTMFEDLGFEFVGPIDGHNIEELDEGLAAAKALNAPTVVLVNTQKGHGYPPAEANPGGYHGVGAFDLSTGNPDVVSEDSYSAVFGRKLLSLAYSDSRICAVTAAMKFGTGLQYFHKALPQRFFDVGIAEQHAVTFSAGLAANGMIPVFAVYSTFLQRSYDQLVHDLAIMNTHAVIGVDRAGIVGEDGETHQGIFDIPFLTTIPNVTIYSPCDYSELEVCLEQAVLHDEGVCAVRYPRGKQPADRKKNGAPTSDIVREVSGNRVCAVTYGRLGNDLLAAREKVRSQGFDFDIIRPVRVFPIEKSLTEELSRYERVFVFEECYKYGSIGEKYAASGVSCDITSLDGFVKHGSVKSLLDENGLSAEKMAERILGYLKHDET